MGSISSIPKKLLAMSLVILLTQATLPLNAHKVSAKSDELQVKTFGDKRNEAFRSVYATKDGGYVAVGDVDGTSQSIVRYSKDGRIIWKDTLDIVGQAFYSVTETTDGGYVVAGDSYSDEIGANCATVLKYSNVGEIEWQNTYTMDTEDTSEDEEYNEEDQDYTEDIEYSDDEETVDGDEYTVENEINAHGTIMNSTFYGVKATSDGGFVVVGSVTFEEQDGSKGLIVKYDRDGNIEWQDMLSEDFGTAFYSIEIDKDGGYIAVGDLETDEFETDALIIKYDSDGSMLWKKTIDESTRDFLTSLKITSDNKYIAVGHSYSQDDNISAGFIVKFNEEDIEWKALYGDDAVFESVAETDDGKFIAVGWETKSNTRQDGLVVKYNGEDIEWSTNFGGSGIDILTSIAKTATGGYIAVGASDSKDGNLSGMNKYGEIAIVVSIPQDLINVESIQMAERNKVLSVGEKASLNATVGPSNATNKAIAWISGNDKVVKLDNKGGLIAVGTGSTVITAVSIDGGYTTTCKVTVKKAKVTGIKLNKNSLELRKGSKAKLIVTEMPSGGTITNIIWSTNNTKVVKIDMKGNITTIGKGKAVITAKTTDGKFKDSCNITVK